MSWYTQSQSSPFFIDQVMVSAYSSNHLVLIVKGKRYEYAVSGNRFNTIIDDLKRNKTPGGKAKASKTVSQIIKNLEPFRIKD